jgi:hypothetical protein
MAKKAPKKAKNPLTNNCQWCKMKLHSVILYPSGAFAPNMVILPHMATAVKRKSKRKIKK